MQVLAVEPNRLLLQIQRGAAATAPAVYAVKGGKLIPLPCSPAGNGCGNPNWIAVSCDGIQSAWFFLHWHPETA